MFEELKRELRRMPKSVTISIDLPLDEKGYLDRLCSQQECGSNFKVLDADWDDKVSDKAAYCPKCGGARPADEFNNPEQQKYIEQVGEAYVAKQLNAMTARAVKNTRPTKISGGLIDLSMSVSYKADPIRTPVPMEASESLRQDFVCENCECRYSTLGAGYFCPACGNNSAVQDFEQTIATTLTAVDLSGHVKATITQHSDADKAEDIHQQMLEDQVENLVTVLQRVTEAMFDQVPNRPDPPFNVFQRIDQASSLWKTTVGVGYQEILDNRELIFLKTMVQRRHKIGHTQGIVDDQYVQHSGDRNYSEGQKLIVAEQDVRELARVVVKLIDGLKAEIDEA